MGKGLGALLLLLVTEQADALGHVSESRAYRKMLQAMADGDTEAFKQWAEELRQELHERGLPHAAENWDRFWRDFLLPRMEEEKRKQRDEDRKRKPPGPKGPRSGGGCRPAL